LLLLDEPTASLDPRSVARVVEIIAMAKEAGVAIAAVFHDPKLIAALADEVVTVNANTGATA
jgi:alpha-D-ribose 1-methylphosphonate 5-triphosphate synthase subunit PhnL